MSWRAAKPSSISAIDTLQMGDLQVQLRRGLDRLQKRCVTHTALASYHERAAQPGRAGATFTHGQWSIASSLAVALDARAH
jgi:hypothetical protein